MARLEFNSKEIMKQMEKQTLEAMKKDFTSKINKLAGPFGEKPRIQFTNRGGLNLSVKVDVQSADLRAKIDTFLKKK